MKSPSWKYQAASSPCSSKCSFEMQRMLVARAWCKLRWRKRARHGSSLPRFFAAACASYRRTFKLDKELGIPSDSAKRHVSLRRIARAHRISSVDNSIESNRRRRISAGRSSQRASVNHRHLRFFPSRLDQHRRVQCIPQQGASIPRPEIPIIPRGWFRIRDRCANSARESRELRWRMFKETVHREAALLAAT